jgi:Mg/Co/Ni transporter MgtE
LWCTTLLQRPLFLVSSSHLSVEPDTLPIHMLGVDSEEKSREVGRLVNSQPALREQYQEVWASLHPEKLKEFIHMARSSKRGPVFHVMPLVEVIGWDETIRQLGTDNIMQHLLADNKSRKKIVAQFLSQLTPEERAELRQETASGERKKEQSK